MPFRGDCLTPTLVKLGAESLVFMQKRLFLKSRYMVVWIQAQVGKECVERVSESHVETQQTGGTSNHSSLLRSSGDFPYTLLMFFCLFSKYLLSI